MSKITRFELERPYMSVKSIENTKVTINGITKTIPTKFFDQIRKIYPSVIGSKDVSTKLLHSSKKFHIDGMIGEVQMGLESTGKSVFVGTDGMVIPREKSVKHYLYVEHISRKDFEANKDTLSKYLLVNGNKLVNSVCGELIVKNVQPENIFKVVSCKGSETVISKQAEPRGTGIIETPKIAPKVNMSWPGKN